jgi:hypothetical protein
MRFEPGAVPPFDFDPSFVSELKARGYDVRTLRFSVKRIIPRVFSPQTKEP